MELVDGNRVSLRAVEDLKIDSVVKDKTDMAVAVEWSTGTGPQALRSVCTCGGTGICQHVIATLETVRTTSVATVPAIGGGDNEEDLTDYTWLPDLDAESQRPRARSIGRFSPQPTVRRSAAPYILIHRACVA